MMGPGMFDDLAKKIAWLLILAAAVCVGIGVAIGKFVLG